MELEKFDKEQVTALVRHMGMGGRFVANWHKIDYKLGRGIKEGGDRCIWTTDGKRIDVSVSSDGGVFVSQTNEPDPEYFLLKKDANNVDHG